MTGEQFQTAAGKMGAAESGIMHALTAYHQALHQYNQTSADAIDARMDRLRDRLHHLTQLRRHIFQYLDAHQPGGVSGFFGSGSRARSAVIRLMDEARAEYASVIETWHQHDKDLSGAPGDALFGGVLGDGAVLLRQILNGRSCISVEGTDAFRRSIFADFAMLMTTQSGVKLVRKLHLSYRTISVKSGRDTEARGGATGNVTQEQMEAAQRNTLEGTQDPYTVEEGKLAGRLREGVGLGIVTVYVKEGLEDSSNSAYDNTGKKIVSPVFIAIAHELLHAKRMLRGRNRRHMTPTQSIWTNAEEERAIRGPRTSENRLREEHNLKPRYGHDAPYRAFLHGGLFSESL